jgi:hypothetical protein
MGGDKPVPVGVFRRAYERAQLGNSVLPALQSNAKVVYCQQAEGTVAARDMYG